jgi:hypothetical protein
VFGGLNRPLAAAAVVAAVVVVVPQTAFAGCGGKPSAEQVYSECLQTGGGGKASHSNSGKSSGTSTQPVTIPKQTNVALKKAGRDGTSLKNLVKGYGTARFLQSRSAPAAAEPTAVGSAFDLGSGPTALLIILAGTAVLILGGSGMRAWRGRHRP